MHRNPGLKNSNKLHWLNILIAIHCLGVLNAASTFDPINILPCDYNDSLNITNGILQSNKSYILNGVEYPEGHYAKINYTIFDKKIIPQKPYIRGCICNVKNCIRFCCPFGTYLELKNHVGKCSRHEAAKNIQGDILHQNNETKRIKYHDHFAILHAYPCKNFNMQDEQYSITHVSIFLHKINPTK